MEFCPYCGEKNLEVEEESYYAGETTWSDGLGIPGPLWLKRNRYRCKKCNLEWHD